MSIGTFSPTMITRTLHPPSLNLVWELVLVTNNFDCVCSNALSLRLRTQFYTPRWPTWSLIEEEDTPRRVLWYKPMSWLGQMRPHHRDESWSGSLWQTFFVSCTGSNMPVQSELPLSVCGCRKFQIDPLGDHLCTCTVHSGTTKAHDWSVDQFPDLFRTTHKVKKKQVSGVVLTLVLRTLRLP